MDARRILIPLLSLALMITIFSSSHAAASGFDDRRAAWLDRDGTNLNGGYDGSTEKGRPYLFAWLEKGKYFDAGPAAYPERGSVHDELQDLLDNHNDAGTLAGITLARIYLQYGDVLRGETCPNGHCYPYPEDWNELDALFRLKASLKHTCVAQTVNGNASQPQRTVETYLYTLEHDDVEFQWTGDSWRNPYNGVTYTDGTWYETQPFTRDSLYNWFIRGVVGGNKELDGSYTQLAVHSLILLHDFADRPLARLDGTPDPEGVVMKRVATMALEVILLDRIMDFSANHHGGSNGRCYRTFLIDARLKSTAYYAFWGLGPKDGGENVGDLYVSGYRLPAIIEDLGIHDDEPDDYWHLHREFNWPGRLDETGQWTFCTPNYNMGGLVEGMPNWHVSLRSEGMPGDTDPRAGQPFQLWIDDLPEGGEDCSFGDPINTNDVLGTGRFVQHRNAMLVLTNDARLHVVRDNPFDNGEANLIPASSFDNDYALSSGWNFFREGRTMVAIRMDVQAGDNTLHAIELATMGVEYNSFAAFQAAVAANAVVEYDNTAEHPYRFTTSRSDVLAYAFDGAVGGYVNDAPAWSFPFDRMSTAFGYGDRSRGNLLTWSGNKLAVTHHGFEREYTFGETMDDWIFEDLALPQSLVADPVEVEVTWRCGEAAPVGAGVTIRNSGTGPLDWTAREVDDVDWLSLDPAAGGDGDDVGIHFEPGECIPGTYSAAVEITDPEAYNSPIFVPVTLVVTAADAIAIRDVSDNFLEVRTDWLDSYDLNNGISSQIKVGTTDEDGFYRRNRALLQFDLDAIPAGASILDARLKLCIRVNANDGTDQTLQVHRVLAPWDELTSCWNRPAEMEDDWDGCSPNDWWAEAAPTTVLVRSDEIEWYEWTGLAGLVRSWIESPASNHGLMIKLDEDDVSEDHLFRFHASSAEDPATRPVLEVTVEEAEETCFLGSLLASPPLP